MLTSEETQRLRLALVTYMRRYKLSYQKTLDEIIELSTGPLEDVIKNKAEIRDFILGSSPSSRKLECYSNYIKLVDPELHRTIADDDFVSNLSDNIAAFLLPQRNIGDYLTALDDQNLKQLWGLYLGFGRNHIDYQGDLYALNLRPMDGTLSARCDLFLLNREIRDLPVKDNSTLMNALTLNIMQTQRNLKILEEDIAADFLDRITEKLSDAVEELISALPYPNRAFRLTYSGVFSVFDYEGPMLLRNTLRRELLAKHAYFTEKNVLITSLFPEEAILEITEKALDAEYAHELRGRRSFVEFYKCQSKTLETEVNRVSWSIP